MAKKGGGGVDGDLVIYQRYYTIRDEYWKEKKNAPQKGVKSESKKVKQNGSIKAEKAGFKSKKKKHFFGFNLVTQCDHVLATRFVATRFVA